MQLYFSLCESRNESMTVSSSHKTVHLQGTGYQAEHLTDLSNQGENSISFRRRISPKVWVSRFCSPIRSAPFPGVFYVNYQSLHRRDFMRCSGHACPSAQKLVQEPIMWFSCTACNFQHIVVTLPWSAFTISTLTELMAQHKVAIKQRKNQATVQFCLCALYPQLGLFPQHAQKPAFHSNILFLKTA